ncbi:hypothetical protein ABT126_43370 [Streptomyces sp. NPDC002012]|uniref:hypothetical protein n=1 Tax=unclassified Streptomyces TaxID=2593676 RepID=UPI0033263982
MSRARRVFFDHLRDGQSSPAGKCDHCDYKGAPTFSPLGAPPPWAPPPWPDARHRPAIPAA